MSRGLTQKHTNDPPRFFLLLLRSRSAFCLVQEGKNGKSRQKAEILFVMTQIRHRLEAQLPRVEICLVMTKSRPCRDLSELLLQNVHLNCKQLLKSQVMPCYIHCYLSDLIICGFWGVSTYRQFCLIEKDFYPKFSLHMSIFLSLQYFTLH